MISDFSSGGDDWSADPHDTNPPSDVRRMFNGSVVAGGGMIPASILLVSFKWLAHSIKVGQVEGEFFNTGDGVGDIERDSSLPYPISAEKYVLIIIEYNRLFNFKWDLRLQNSIIIMISMDFYFGIGLVICEAPETLILIKKIVI